MMDRRIVILCIAAAAVSCGTQQKLRLIEKQQMEATLAMSGNYESDLPELHVDRENRDTLRIVDFEGRKTLLMNAVRDEDGEMVATDRIQAAVITARFRNVAERHGEVDIRFEVHVPREMQDGRWQLCFYPDLFVLGDSIRLEPVLITGAEYRKAQLRGYQQYQKFIDSIITDSTRFVRLRLLEIFIERNIPQLYALKKEERYVSDEEFASIFGVSEREAIDHYTSKWRVRINEGLKAKKDKMFHKYVKAPIATEGLKLDTVIASMDGDFVYEYVQTIHTQPKLSRADVVLSGEILEEGRRIYSVPRSEPLSFYISSLSSFVDPSVKYVTKVIERRAEANSACWIDFKAGQDDINPELSHNGSEIGRIKRNFVQLLENEEYDMDSIVVRASCSPEGTFASNVRLSERRAKSVSDYFHRYIRHCRDSIARERGAVIHLDDTWPDGREEQPISFISYGNPENWRMLENLVQNDTVLNEAAKSLFAEKMRIPDPDERENALHNMTFYRRLREVMYPRLRTVEFSFYLHRKGMVKDTVHTTAVDTAYMNGVQAIRDRDYAKAVTLLRPYKDFNTAIAYCSMDYNQSALEILQGLPASGEVEYMLAILYSREGDDQNAVQHYMNSLHLNSSYLFRGNLDPEISVLIHKYGLNKETN